LNRGPNKRNGLGCLITKCPEIPERFEFQCVAVVGGSERCGLENSVPLDGCDLEAPEFASWCWDTVEGLCEEVWVDPGKSLVLSREDFDMLDAGKRPGGFIKLETSQQNDSLRRLGRQPNREAAEIWHAPVGRSQTCPHAAHMSQPKVAWGHSQIGELPKFGTLPLVAHKHARTVRACHNLRL
jgi:hypothetical protein